MTLTQIHQLATLRLDPAVFGRRDPPAASKILSQEFWQGYDATTLIYDCWHNDQTNMLCVACPTPLNFRDYLSSATFSMNGKTLFPARVTKGRHHEMLSFAGAPKAEALDLMIGQHSWRLPVHPVNEALAGHRVLYTLSRNNDLRWIQDWARYHVALHGADGILICDNGSDAYTAQDLADALGAVDGLRTALIVSAPLPFGPKASTCRNVSAAKYLQTSLMNIAAKRFLADAKSVLNVDIDELVVSAKGESIFEAVERSIFGLITFPGHWRYTQIAPARHADHIYRRDQDKPCPTKYALRPSASIAQRPWQVHAIAGVNRKIFQSRKRFSFYHCKGISTSWKSDRHPKPVTGLVLDRETQHVLNAVLARQT